MTSDDVIKLSKMLRSFYDVIDLSKLSPTIMCVNAQLKVKLINT